VNEGGETAFSTTQKDCAIGKLNLMSRHFFVLIASTNGSAAEACPAISGNGPVTY
jgi:hypothetical protein